MNNNFSQKNIVYILTNEAMPGIVKIGKTDGSIEQRMRELYKTGVPVPFECFRASVVENAADVERRIHRAFDKYRINKNREFFEIEPENVVEILELVELENVTPKEDVVETSDDKVALERLEQKSKRYNFKIYGIPAGATLVFDRDPNKTATVLESNNILYEGEELSLSAAAVKALNELGYNWQQARGPAHWTYGGETLKDRRERIESE